MSTTKKNCVLIACALAAMLLMTATSEAGPILDWLFGTPPCMTAQTTYTPPYYTAGYAAEAYAAPVGGCSSCAPQVVQYAPYTSYRPVYTALTIPRPVTTYYAPTAAYYPAAGCNSCAAPTTAYYPSTACNTCATPVTAYRPVMAFTQQVRMIPYTTYRMAYMPMTYIGYAPACTSCASPCATSYGSCSSCGEGVTTYGSSSCSSCQGAVSSSYVTPSAQAPSSAAPVMSPPPSTESAQPPQTFQEQKPPVEDNKPAVQDNNTYSPDNKPASDTNPNLIPVPETRLNSSPGPQLVNPDNRTTSLPVRQAIYLVKRPAAPVETPAARQNAGWRESRD